MTMPSIGLGPTESSYTERVHLDPWPAPERVSADVDLSGIMSKPIFELVTMAGQFGWSCRVTSAVGCWPSIGGRPSRQRASYAVRMWRGRQRAVAVYVEPPNVRGTWSWDTLLEWDLDSFPRGLANIGMFQDMLFGLECKPMWPGPKDWSCPYFGPVHGPDKPKRVRS